MTPPQPPAGTTPAGAVATTGAELAAAQEAAGLRRLQAAIVTIAAANPGDGRSFSNIRYAWLQITSVH